MNLRIRGILALGLIASIWAVYPLNGHDTSICPAYTNCIVPNNLDETFFAAILPRVILNLITIAFATTPQVLLFWTTQKK